MGIFSPRDPEPVECASSHLPPPLSQSEALGMHSSAQFHCTAGGKMPPPSLQVIIDTQSGLSLATQPNVSPASQRVMPFSPRRRGIFATPKAFHHSAPGCRLRLPGEIAPRSPYAESVESSEASDTLWTNSKKRAHASSISTHNHSYRLLRSTAHPILSPFTSGGWRLSTPTQ
jgi:hypothetical protein